MSSSEAGWAVRPRVAARRAPSGTPAAISSAATAPSFRSLGSSELHDPPCRSRRRRARTRPGSPHRRRQHRRSARQRARHRVEVRAGCRARPPRSAAPSRGSPASRSSSRGSAFPPARSRNSRGDAPTSKPSILTAVALASDERVGDLGTRAPVRSSTSAQHRTTPVAGRERLRDRRGRPQDVDDDPERCRRRLARGVKATANAHPATTLLRTWLRPSSRPCYRHPDRLTGLSCSECGRPDLHGVHDDGSRRDPLPGALRPAAGRATRDAGVQSRGLRGRRREGDDGRWSGSTSPSTSPSCSLGAA